MSKIERISVPVPAGFKQGKIVALTAKVCEAKGEGWEFESFLPDDGKITFTRETAMLEVHDGENTAKKLRLPSGTKPSDGDKIAARMEDANPGYVLVRFDPHLGEAIMSKMTDDELRCRGSVSVALNVKPWEVLVRERSEGGFDVVLPRTYVASKHDAKLLEVVETVVGRVGWRVEVSPKHLTCRFVPGEPPIFPSIVPYPLSELGTRKSNPMKSLLGYRLPLQGEGLGEPIFVDWRASSWILLAGTPGAGKTVALNSILAQQIGAGASVFIVDDRSKSVDFLWAKDLVMTGGWGCDSEEEAVATLGMVYELGQERAKQMAKAGYVNWLDMPDSIRFKPIFGIIDEAAALLVQDPVPRGVPKDDPIVEEINHLNYMRALIGRYMNKITAELRFVGVRMIISNQVTNQSTGLPPSMKSKIGHRVLQGTNPSKPARTQTFNDEQSVPSVPEHVKASGDNARGVGLCDLEGQGPAIYKSLYSKTDEYRTRLLQLHVPQTNAPAPSAALLAKFVPAQMGELDDDGPAPRDRGRKLESWETDDFGEPLSGNERANAARHEAAVGGGGGRPTKSDREETALSAHNGGVAVTQAPRCDSCGAFINPAAPEHHCF